MNRFYAKKILFNITQADLDRMTDMRNKLGLQQSEYIHRLYSVCGGTILVVEDHLAVTMTKIYKSTAS